MAEVLPKPRSKKPNSAPLTKEHCLISCIYNAEIFSGSGPPTSTQSTVVNLASTNSVSGMNPKSLSPPAIQRALSSAKATALLASGSLKCVTCDVDAVNLCSVIEAYRGSNNTNNSPTKKFDVLQITERLICSCNDDTCLSEARQRRNNIAGTGKGGRGVDFKLAFRCAIEPISRVLSVVTEAGKHVASTDDIGGKENANDNVNIEHGKDAKKMKMTSE